MNQAELQNPQNVVTLTIGGSTTSVQICPYCGLYGIHAGLCPRIEEIEYHPNGSVKRVKLRGETHRAIPAAPRCPNAGRPCFCTGQCMGAGSGKISWLHTTPPPDTIDT